MNQSSNIPIKSSWQCKPGHIITKWVSEVDPKLPYPEYPRPHLVRSKWLNLNGLWNYSISTKKTTIENMLQNFPIEGQILVPYPIESALSGVKKPLLPSNYLWYARKFSVPKDWKNERIILHFGAVDWEATVWVNGIEIGSHRGGDVGFQFDITQALQSHLQDENEIIIRVWDPSEKGLQERGKQRLNPYGIYYNAMSGIWQTVWLEPVSSAYIESIQINPDIDTNEIQLYVNVNCGSINLSDASIHDDSNAYSLKIQILDKNSKIVETTGKINTNQKIVIPSPKLWSPDHPFLYDIQIQLMKQDTELDQIKSYFGMRKISLGKDETGILRIMLNNEFIFQYGPLDQGWWPDGLYTAPTDAAMKWDIEITKAMGFNMIRKHVKVEPARWYYYCDVLGMLVWQDMPSGGSYGSKSWLLSLITAFAFKKAWKTGRIKKENCEQYYYELNEMMTQFAHFPSIVVWVPFNEAWGQFDTAKVTDFMKERDSSRLIDSASGWVDYKTGDIHSIHAYPGPKRPDTEELRAIALSEFGGLGLPVQDHLWDANKRNWGYRKMETDEELLEKYSKLVENLRSLIPEGLSAAIYTQTTDVEGEVNGLITYDREKIKIPVETLKKIHDPLYNSL